MFTNSTGEHFVDHAREMESIFLAETFHDGGVSNHVREQHGDLTSLTQARRFARENVFHFIHFRNQRIIYRPQQPAWAASIIGCTFHET